MTPLAAPPKARFRVQTLEALASRHPAMASLSPFRRRGARSLLLEINPFQILAAVIRANRDGVTTIEATAEFENDDDRGLACWLDEKFGEQRTFVAVVGSILPPEAILQRENLQLQRLGDPDYLPALLEELRRVNHTARWTIAAVDPQTGTRLPAEGPTHPGLLLGLGHHDIESFQRRLLDHRLVPRRIEFGLLPLLGAVAGLAETRPERRATVVIVIEQEHTTAYIVGKEGVHTPPAVPHGFSSIVQAVCKEFNLTTADEVRERLHQADDELMIRATKFVRAIGRDLKPRVDSYEMTTGQPVGEIHCAYLPPALQWIVEPLAQVMQRPAMEFDSAEWLPTVKLQAAPDLPFPGSHWLGALSLVSTPMAPNKAANGASAAPWRIDCRFIAQPAAIGQVRRRFKTLAVLAALTSACITFTAWQWSVIRSLDADTAYWRQQVTSHQALFDELTHATTSLRAKSERFDRAEALMGPRIPATDFILNLGRSLPPNMQVNRIEATAGRVAMSGRLQEAPDQSSLILGRYMEELRKTPAIGSLFSSITLTALQRDDDSSDSLAFEITFTLPEATP